MSAAVFIGVLFTEEVLQAEPERAPHLGLRWATSWFRGDKSTEILDMNTNESLKFVFT